MKIDILTLFPEMISGYFNESIIKRSIEKGLVEINLHNFRKFSVRSNNQVDDTPYGGGAGMVLQCDPIFKCVESLKTPDSTVILVTPDGKTYNQKIAKELKEGTGLRLQEVKGMDIIDLNGNLKGVVEDCIIDEVGLTIKGLVVSTGLIERLLKGKEVILINECILGEDYVLFVGYKNVTLKSMPRKEEKNEVSN